MDVNQIFSIANSLALMSWIPLIIAPFNQKVRHVLLGSTVALLSATYAFLFFQTFDADALESFSTLEGLMILFSNKEAVLIGWIHYLAFDLFVGISIAKNAEKQKLNPWVVRPIFLFTFMAGPLGFFLYMIYKTVATRQYSFE